MKEQSDQPIPTTQAVARIQRGHPKVNYIANDDDFKCILLGALGFAYSRIRKETGLNNYQICYRLKKQGIKLADYRNGTGTFASMVLHRTRSLAERQLLKQLK